MQNDEISCFDAIRALAFMGDMSMGQPTDHSVKVAWIAHQIAEGLGFSEEQCDLVVQVALLRWVGCTANATEVAEVMSDDVRGRGELLALRLQAIKVLVPPNQIVSRTRAISAIHCEVAIIIAKTLGLSSSVQEALGALFETWDGNGHPHNLKGAKIPIAALIVVLAGDIEVFTREYGVAEAMHMLQLRADIVYPQYLADFVVIHLQEWFSRLSEPDGTAVNFETSSDSHAVNLSLLADVIDLKLPWLTGNSRAVALLADVVAAGLNLPIVSRNCIRRSALIHGLGRVSVPNSVWNQTGSFSTADWEKVRLCPYWTSRAAAQIKSLTHEAEIASYAYERLDSSGYFRAASINSTPIEFRILPVVTTWLALQSPRPWRDRMSVESAINHMQQQVFLKRFDQSVVDTVLGVSARIEFPRFAIKPSVNILSPRELEILRCIGQGDNNKSAARTLGISPATVRTHVESVFRKLECNSRAAAILKASTLGLL